jgi:hypothetical protein
MPFCGTPITWIEKSSRAVGRLFGVDFESGGKHWLSCYGVVQRVASIGGEASSYI